MADPNLTEWELARKLSQLMGDEIAVGAIDGLGNMTLKPSIQGEITLNAPKMQNGADNGQKLPFLNLGCGKTHFPSEPPPGHGLIDREVYQYPNWLNVDKVEGVGADKVFDLFAYPWPLESDSYAGAVLGHIVEHIPHEIKLSELAQQYIPFRFEKTDQARKLELLQDGWYAFFAELYRVLVNDAPIYIIAPYGWSDGAITDPSHTRYLTVNTFTHSMSPMVNDGPTFSYNNGGINLQLEKYGYRPDPMHQHLIPQESDTPDIAAYKRAVLQENTMYTLNAIQDFYVQLRVVK